MDTRDGYYITSTLTLAMFANPSTLIRTVWSLSFNTNIAIHTRNTASLSNHMLLPKML